MKHLLTQDIEGADWGRIVAIGEGDAAQIFIKGFDLVPSPYKLVDLGLPSGTLWADRNLGAASPEDAGLYFQWGDTQGYTAEQVGNGEGKKAFASNYSDYKFYASNSLTKYAEAKEGVVLESADDAAIAETKTKLRMPTQADMGELFNTNNTTMKWVVETKNGDTWDGGKEYESMTAAGVEVNTNLKLDTYSNFVEEGSTKRFLGVRFYGKGGYASNSIFVPAAGFCVDGSVQNRGNEGDLWSSSLGSGYAFVARYGRFSANGNFNVGAGSRGYGFSVRAVAGGVQ